MSESQNRMSPIVAIAAVSVIIFSVVGVGVMTGYIPSSISKHAEQQAAVPAAPAKATAEPAKAPATATSPKKTTQSTASAPKKTTEPARVASAEPAGAPAPVCANCGTVSAVNVLEQKGEGSGLGAVAGGVVGGVLGNQVGRGSGRTAATVVGAGAGAYAGHEIEKYAKSTKHYDVAVRMEDGSSRNFSYEKEPAFRVGEKVKVVEGTLVAN